MEMIKLLLISLLLTNYAHAFIKSASIGVSTISSDSALQDEKQDPLIEFKPNVTSGTSVSIETEYLVVGYVFAGGQAQVEDQEKSKYQDLRFNFNLSHFDFRVSLQKYAGALVDAGGKKFFYKDYDVESTNARFHYYFNSKHLDFIRPGHALIRRVAPHSGLRASGSWLIGVNADDRRIHLPEALQAEHLAILTARGLGYNSQFDAFSWGPMLGYDGLFEISSFFIRLKLAIGPAFQSTGGTSRQSEVALTSGFAFAQNHMISVAVDLFTMSFKDDNKYINNTNSQANFHYTYAF
jgi:hypothetical protein